MRSRFDFVAIGGGLAGATAVETLRNEGAEGHVALLCEEASLPYQRPPLSKSFITSDAQPKPRPVLGEPRYRELGIDVLLDDPVTAVDPVARRLRTRSGDEIEFGQLLIATGATPRRLDIPGCSLAGVHYLRSLPDALAIRRSAQASKRAVVVGGSFIGLELAASLRQRGIAVTLIECGNLLDALNDTRISSFYRRAFEQRGVEVVLGDSPAAIRGDGSVDAVVTRAGRILPCEMVAIGVGVLPATGFLHGSGIAIDDGVVVDRFLQTSHQGVFAAGDVASFFDPVFGCRHRVEHWDNAIKQGRLAARNMLGQRLRYDEVPYFYCEAFDLGFNLLGMFDSNDERIDRGSLESGSFASFYLRNDVPRALFSLGRSSDETKVTEVLIRHRVHLGREKKKLCDPTFALSRIPNQTIFILQGGGAYGAFECGAVKALEEAGILPDVAAGVSIGAFNGAIIAGNPDRAAEALESFWSDLATASPDLPDENLRRQVAQGQIALFGVPQFFHPRWWLPSFGATLPSPWTSLYDTAPALTLLRKYVDFAKLKSSRVRLIVSAVDVQTSELVVFDSYVDDLTPEHILASGSLPPGFPWTTIAGRHFWDGGIVSNSPLELVVDRCGSAGKRVFVVDLFSATRNALPRNLAEVTARQSEILYCERIRSDLKTRSLVRDYRKLVEEIVAELPEDAAARVRRRPNFIQMMGEDAPMTITRIVRESDEDESASKDYDFSRKTLDQLRSAGYRTAMRALGR